MPRNEQKKVEPRCDKCGTQASKSPRGKMEKSAAEGRAAQQEIQQQQAQRQAAMQQQRAAQAMRPAVRPGMAGPGAPTQQGPPQNPQAAMLALRQLLAQRGGR